MFLSDQCFRMRSASGGSRSGFPPHIGTSCYSSNHRKTGMWNVQRSLGGEVVQVITDYAVELCEMDVTEIRLKRYFSLSLDDITRRNSVYNESCNIEYHVELNVYELRFVVMFVLVVNLPDAVSCKTWAVHPIGEYLSELLFEAGDIRKSGYYSGMKDK
ncbi:hypothetical protein CLF_103801 [Clonorchis sinensis]|uniref:Uncharacterized protein n=1 Tax=Clonorchis sinensis TaxID=79923 RepID=G7YAF0_CLOSI|nr:hypothetical protein CLF_103801 [Clonorchis sinensis]